MWMRMPRVVVSVRRSCSRAGGCGFVAEDGEEGAEAALLHDDGGLHDVEGAEGEGSFGDVGEDLGGEVV